MKLWRVICLLLGALGTGAAAAEQPVAGKTVLGKAQHQRQHHAQRLAGATFPFCPSPNPNLQGPPNFLDGCVLSSVGLNLTAPLTSPHFLGSPTAPTPTLGDDSLRLATTDFVAQSLAAVLAVPNSTLIGGNGHILTTPTGSAATAYLNAFIGDSGAGGVKGLVPAPNIGDAAAGKVLGAGGGWVGIATAANPTATVSGSAINGSATTFLRSDAAPALAATAVMPGSYTNSSFTVDQQGRLTAAASGAAAPAAANPTATIGTAAVNGTAATFMRSDAAPAIPQCSSSTFGACKVDGTTITASGGVITASGVSAGVASVSTSSPNLVIGGTGAGPYTGAVTVNSRLPTRSQAGGSIVAADGGGLVYNTGGTGATLPVHTTAGFGAGFAADLLTDSTAATLTVTTDTCNGNSTESLGIKQGMTIIGDGSSTYKCILGIPEPVASTLLLASSGRVPQWTNAIPQVVTFSGGVIGGHTNVTATGNIDLSATGGVCGQTIHYTGASNGTLTILATAVADCNVPVDATSTGLATIAAAGGGSIVGNSICTSTPRTKATHSLIWVHVESNAGSAPVINVSGDCG